MIQVFTCNKFKNINSYLIYNNEKKALLFDTCYLCYDHIINYTKKNKIQITDIFITHGHFPHFWGITEICKSHKNPNVFIGQDDLPLLFDARKNLSSYFENVEEYHIDTIKNLKVVTEDMKLKINGYNVNIYKREFHTRGSLMFEIPERKYLFSGDFVFKDETFFYDGMIQANKEKEKVARKIFDWLIENFEEDYWLFPGHYHYGFQLKNILKDKEASFLRKYLDITK